AMQRLVHDRVLGAVLNPAAAIDVPPLPIRILDRIGLLRRIPARVVGLGIRREHVRSPATWPELEW
ncbi:MAG: FAD-dependent oxidoreductase, partial [Sphingomonadaceae bacterium]|nr:FAD-dependent oxidoreductase [Sphingomonadaceae bacterium]